MKPSEGKPMEKTLSYGKLQGNGLIEDYPIQIFKGKWITLNQFIECIDNVILSAVKTKMKRKIRGEV